MALSMSFRLNQYAEAFLMSDRQLLNVAEAALTEVGQFWIDAFMPLHFEHDAHLRYGYRYRSKKWNRYKMDGRIPPDGFYARRNRKLGIVPANLWTLIVPHPEGKPRPFDARGDMKRHVMENRRLAVQGKRGGASNLVLKVFMPFGHPIPAEYVGEMTAVNAYEHERLQQKFHAALRAAIREGGFRKRGGVMFSRGGFPINQSA